MIRVDYFGDWRGDVSCSACGWKGTGSELATETFDELFTLDCPKHRRRALSGVGRGTGSCRQGHPEAIQMLRRERNTENQKVSIHQAGWVASVRLTRRVLHEWSLKTNGKYPQITIEREERVVKGDLVYLSDDSAAVRQPLLCEEDAFG